MTSVEAIEILKARRMCAAYVDSEYVDSVDIEAIDIAISALEKQAQEKPLTVLSCGDDVTAIRKELLAAVQLLRNECKNRDPNKDCGSDRCQIWEWCDKLTEENGGGASPCFWPDPEEGGDN